MLASSPGDSCPKIRRMRRLSMERRWSTRAHDCFVRPLTPGLNVGYSAPAPSAPVTGTTAIKGYR